MTLVFESLARPKVDVATLRRAQRTEQAALNCAQWQMKAQQKCQMESQWQVELAACMQQHLSAQERLAEQDKLLQAQANEVLNLNALATNTLAMNSVATEANVQPSQINATKVNMLKGEDNLKSASRLSLFKASATNLTHRAEHLEPEHAIIKQAIIEQAQAMSKAQNGLASDQQKWQQGANDIGVLNNAHLVEKACILSDEFASCHTKPREMFKSLSDSKATGRHANPQSVNQVQAITHRVTSESYLAQVWLRQTIVQAELANQQQRHQLAQSMSQQRLPQSADNIGGLKLMLEEWNEPQVSRANRVVGNHDVNTYFKHFAQLDEATIRRIADIFAESYAEKVQQGSSQSLSLTASLRRNR